ncbi:VOC family protein [Rhodospirillales bacterium]|nr:VOC family protein [Rhodospirillales bacterium]
MIKIKGFEHISIGAEDTEPSAGVLGLFGIKPLYGEDIHPHGVTTTYYEHEDNENTRVRFEIIRPVSEDAPLRKFLEKRGPGIHHICMQVEDLEDAMQQIKGAGGELVEPVFDDSRGRHVFVHPKFTGGFLLGLIELHPGQKP